MKFSEKWLREWVDPPVPTEGLVEQLTMAGLEVDSVEPAGMAIEGVVVGEVLYIDLSKPCEFLNKKTGKCTVYKDRFKYQPKCKSLDELQYIGGVPNLCEYKDDYDFRYKNVLMTGECERGK